MLVEREPVALERDGRARVDREHDGLGQAVQPFDDAGEPLRACVRLAVHGRDDVAAGRQLELGEKTRPAPRDRRELHRRVRHHVTDHLDSSLDALGGERLARTLVGREQHVRQAVDLDPVALLGHLEVAAPEARLDVRDGNACLDRRPGSGERRVRVAVDEHRVRLRRSNGIEDRGRHRRDLGRVEVEPHVWLGQAELLEEDCGELRVVVLARVQEHLVDPSAAQRDGERRRLDELRAVPDDRENPHRSLHYASRAGR